MRKPLSMRNSEDSSRPNVMKAKKMRSHYPVLDRPTIVSQLNIVLQDSAGRTGPAKIVEEDLKEPTVSSSDELKLLKMCVCVF